MKYFLKKRDNEFWLESRSENHCTVIAEQEPDVNDLTSKLSIKNCQAIERGWDLDELISESDTSHLALFTSDSHELMYDEGFKAGFKKALEILGDKKFSEEDMNNTMNWIMNEYFEFYEQPTTARREHYIQSLQQTEWEVEIEMERSQFIVDKSLRNDIKNGFNYTTKLDKKGCLILKRK